MIFPQNGDETSLPGGGVEQLYMVERQFQISGSTERRSGPFMLN